MGRARHAALCTVLVAAAGACDGNPVTVDAEPATTILFAEGDRLDNGVPFGCASDGRYQQWYAARTFLDAEVDEYPLELTSITFFGAGGRPTLFTADFRLRLSVTDRTGFDLSDQLDENMGSREAVVLDARLSGVTANPELTLTLETPYRYDPQEGNLLLDLVVENSMADDNCGTFRGRVQEWDPFATDPGISMSRRPAYGGLGTGYGLETRFEVR